MKEPLYPRHASVRVEELKVAPQKIRGFTEWVGDDGHSMWSDACVFPPKCPTAPCIVCGKPR